MKSLEEWLKKHPCSYASLGNVKAAYNAGLERAAEIADKHYVSISDLDGSGWSEWGYSVDIAAAIRKEIV